MVSGKEEEEPHTDDMGYNHCQESREISIILSEYTSQKNSHTKAQVPGSEDGGVGGGPAAVRRQVYNHVLHSRPHVTVAEAYQYRRAVVGYVGRPEGEDSVTYCGYEDSSRNIADELAFSEGFGSNETGEYKARCQKHEICSRA